MKFVIVEDEIRIREGIRKLLQKLDKENIVIGEAENGMEGMELILRENPDVIITDVRMPVMDGLQMLEKVYQAGCDAKAIVISAYSEFEYAKSALRMGVTEYLLKPIVMSDFTDAVKRVKEEKRKADRHKPEQIGTLDQIIRNLINGDLTLEEEVDKYLRKNFKIQRNMPVILCVAYLEQWSERKCRSFVQEIKNGIGTEAICFELIEEKKKEIHFVMYGYKDGCQMKRRVQTYFLGNQQHINGIALGWAEMQGMGCLKDYYEKLEHYLEWNILLGYEVVISYPEIKYVQTALCVYPVEIEAQLKNAICVNDSTRVKEYVQKFHEYFQNRKMYEPKKVKECYVRFFWAVINFAKEMGNKGFEDYDYLTLLEKVMHTKTMLGLELVTEELLQGFQGEEEKIQNINVKRAVSMVHEFYRKGITLEEIALKLGITPEYLGTQFHQEMGVTFSGYIKRIRINKAKELLLGTQLKLYEIAVEVGYTDAKYFSKVFKAATGQLPADYRRTHK